jgi:hypothetical protein
MKAERRHELQENALAKWMNNFPVMVRLYADRILLGLVVVLLIIVLINWRVNTSRKRIESASNSLAAARSAITQLLNTPMSGLPEQITQRRSEIRSVAESSIRDAVDNASPDDVKLHVGALLARADLLWTLANLPEPANTSSTSQPASTQASSPKEDLLKDAESIYQRVINEYASQTNAKMDAIFGLAAIDEDHRNFDSAKQRYEQVQAMKDAPRMYHDLATIRLSMLDQIRQPLLIGQLANKPPELRPMVLTPTTAPSTAPSTMIPPTTGPGTAPAR